MTSISLTLVAALIGQSKGVGETLSGPPIVTAKSWTIFDARTGGFVAGADADAVRDMASTTKVMTAFVILEMVEKNESILQEEVAFSSRAAKTEGSAAKVGEGEKVLVKHLLYGLLLPSGNDAAVALAEHFGPRTAAAKDRPNEKDAYTLFVTEMNRRGGELGLSQTTFRNPHGLTNAKHKSTASDLAKLTLAALRKPIFREIIVAKQFSAPVKSPSGGVRTATWTNTNQLLGLGNYYGVKTGTTSAAGSCLIAGGVHESDDLLLVLLGSASNEARYADARNLFRWAWAERRKSAKSIGEGATTPVGGRH